VPGGKVVVLSANLLLEQSNLGREEFDRTAAIRTHHVVMAAAVVLMLVTRNPVVKRDLAGQAAFREQFERAVHGGIADAGVLLLDQPMEFIGREVIASFEKGAQNRVALGRLLQAHALQVAVEDLLGLADHLAG